MSSSIQSRTMSVPLYTISANAQDSFLPIKARDGRIAINVPAPSIPFIDIDVPTDEEWYIKTSRKEDVLRVFVADISENELFTISMDTSKDEPTIIPDDGVKDVYGETVKGVFVSLYDRPMYTISVDAQSGIVPINGRYFAIDINLPVSRMPLIGVNLPSNEPSYLVTKGAGDGGLGISVQTEKEIVWHMELEIEDGEAFLIGDE